MRVGVWNDFLHNAVEEANRAASDFNEVVTSIDSLPQRESRLKAQNTVLMDLQAAIFSLKLIKDRIRKRKF